MFHRSVSALLVLLAVSSQAMQTTVTSLDALVKTAAAAKAGDEIILKDGLYTASAALAFTGLSGAVDKPIVIRSQTVGGATIAGKTALVIDKCAFVNLSGFRFTFTALSDRGLQVKGSHHIGVLQNHFQLTEAAATKNYWLMVDGELADGSTPHHIAIAGNAFWNKKEEGTFIVVYGKSSPYGIAKYVTIERNHFKGHSFTGSNGGESIRFGDSNRQNDPTHSEIRQNLFEDCKGDVEVVSVKTTRLKVWGNTLRGNQGSIVLRHGDSCQVFGNFLIGNIGGIRMYGDNQSIVGNYLENNSNVKPDGSVSSSYSTLGIGMGSQADLANGENTYDQPSNGIVAFNTLVNNSSRGLEVVKIKTETFVPLGMSILNNLVVSDKGSLSQFAATPSPATIDGNLLFGKAAAGDLKATFSVDPKLVLGADGIYRPGQGSPVIDAAVRPTLWPSWYTTDMDGQVRAGTFDLGADEISTTAKTLRPLNAADVGPQVGGVSGNLERNAISGMALQGEVEAEIVDLSGRSHGVVRMDATANPASRIPGLKRGAYVVKIRQGAVVATRSFLVP